MIDRKRNLIKTLKALGQETRFDILELLDNLPFRVGEISESLNLNLTTISQHLNILENSGLISKVQEGREKFCFSTDKARRILRFLEENAKRSQGEENES